MQANSFPSANFAWFSDSYNQLYPLLFLLRREVVYHTTPYLSSHPPGQSELSVGNASAPHSYRSQAVCDFLWRIPSADTSLSERNSEMIGVYYQRLTHESLRIGSTIFHRISLSYFIFFITLRQYDISLGKRSCIYLSVR